MSPGQKVVCVEDDLPNWVRALFEQVPKKGVVYVVRGSEVILDGVLILRLVGIIGPMTTYVGEVGFHAWRFRPLEEVQAENAARNIAHKVQRISASFHFSDTPRPEGWNGRG